MSGKLQIPPGLAYDGHLVEVVNDGVQNEWVKYEKVKEYTNAFIIIDDQKMLLGLKKRGFGVGLWNGFGGKVDPGETPAQAAVRELEEEAGITAPLKQCGTLFFVVDGVDTAFNISVFSAHEYSGDVIETDEMRPEWFSIQDSLLPRSTTAGPTETHELPQIPLEKMWADDEFWMPLMFARRYFVGRADFGADSKMRRWWFGATPLNRS
ncbi:NUDIX hydrolase domain-like protein [Trametes gibbosa]|nr:NUDIX hydrolase domain-like protein [Trametes gibbosa]